MMVGCEGMMVNPNIPPITNLHPSWSCKTLMRDAGVMMVFKGVMERRVMSR